MEPDEQAKLVTWNFEPYTFSDTGKSESRDSAYRNRGMVEAPMTSEERFRRWFDLIDR